jgi:hypothetical protein
MALDPEKEADLENRKLALEERKFDHEQNKHSEDRSQRWWTQLSIIIPLALAVLTLAGSQLAQWQQGRQDFELQAAEIIMTSESPTEAEAKARALYNLFPNRLSSGFPDSFRSQDYSGPSEDVIRTRKMELLKLLAEYPSERETILKAWQQAFPEDTWAKDIQLK